MHYPSVIDALCQEVDKARAEAATLRAENANLKTVMVAAAEEISAHWQAHCDSEGYGPQNLVRRLEEGIPSEYGYTAGAFAALRAEVERLERDAERLDWLEKNTRPLYLSSHTVVAPTTKGDGSYERREVLDGWVTSINDEPHPTPRAAIDAAIAQTKETV